MRLNKKLGLTLVEIIIAMVILALITAGLLGIFVSGKRYTLFTGHKIEGVSFARDKFEEFDNDYDSIADGSDTKTFSNGRTANRTWTVVEQDWDGDAIPDAKYVTVEITWQESW